VPFPAILDLSAFTADSTPVANFAEWKGRQKASAELLQLYGVIEHQGNFDGGHYVAFVRLGGVWYRFNDSVVTKVEEADILKVKAFLLFYERL
jgi:ubiquitin C-terminal hydrolase